MRRALARAATPGVPLGPNPRVGCVLLAPDGRELATGHHRGAGSPHAEAAALAAVGGRADGATAVVTLEPCTHQGRTGPCTDALIAAGVSRVVIARRDPNPVAAGGVEVLRGQGVEVIEGVLSNLAAELNRYWEFGLTARRPYVTWKAGTSLDGRIAAADGSSQWITSAAARRDAQQLRRRCDAIAVGTGTALADDPALTIRDSAGRPAPRIEQPLRVIVGRRALPADARLNDASAETVQLRTHDPAEVVASLYAEGRRHLLLEGGGTLVGAFLRAGLVDEAVLYLAPLLLGDGLPAVTGLGVTTLTEAARWRLVGCEVVGEDEERNVRVTVRAPAAAAAEKGGI